MIMSRALDIDLGVVVVSVVKEGGVWCEGGICADLRQVGRDCVPNVGIFIRKWADCVTS